MRKKITFLRQPSLRGNRFRKGCSYQFGNGLVLMGFYVNVTEVLKDNLCKFISSIYQLYKFQASHTNNHKYLQRLAASEHYVINYSSCKVYHIDINTQHVK